MEATYRYREEADLDDLTPRLSNEFDRLALNLEAAARDGLPIDVDLYRILNQCFELDSLWRKLRDNVGHTASVNGFVERNSSRALIMIRWGQPNLSWDIKLAPIDRGTLCAHARTCEEDNWPKNREKSAVERYLGLIASALNMRFSNRVDFALILMDHMSINEYCVLGLFRNMTGPLSTAEVLTGTDGALYVRGNVQSVWGETADCSCQSTFIRYGYGLSTRIQIWNSFSNLTGEPQVADERAKEGRDREAHLPNKPSDFSAFAGAAALDPYPVMPNNEAETVVGGFQESYAHTQIDVFNQQVSMIDHSRFAAGPSSVFPAPEQSTDVYGFTQFTPSALMNAGAQGLLPYESSSWAAPVSMTSPEADSPWSERESPPPPYVLSPGTYHLRLEAATRPSPPSG